MSFTPPIRNLNAYEINFILKKGKGYLRKNSQGE